MQQFQRRAGLLLLALFCILWVISRPASGAQSGPQQLYQRAWQLVRDSDINKIGIAPDVVADGDRNKQLAKAEEVLQQQITQRGNSPVGVIAAPPKRYGFKTHTVSPRS